MIRTNISVPTRERVLLHDERGHHKRAVCLFSGGYDSTLALLWSLERWPTTALFVSYGQPYQVQEDWAVERVWRDLSYHTRLLGVKKINVDARILQRGEVRWIPYRNWLLMALACNHAVAEGADIIVVGSKSAEYRPEDAISYRDSTSQFFHDYQAMLDKFVEKDQAPLTIAAPLMGWTKREVLQLLHEHGVDLRGLWNCYRTDGGTTPCGTCEHCRITQPLVEEIMRKRNMQESPR